MKNIDEITTLFLPVCILVIAMTNLFVSCNNVILTFLVVHLLFVSYSAVAKNMKQREEDSIEDLTFY
jgi:type IV secretory pathway VirB3-like protein